MWQRGWLTREGKRSTRRSSHCLASSSSSSTRSKSHYSASSSSPPWPLLTQPWFGHLLTCFVLIGFLRRNWQVQCDQLFTIRSRSVTTINKGIWPALPFLSYLLQNLRHLLLSSTWFCIWVSSTFVSSVRRSASVSVSKSISAWSASCSEPELGTWVTCPQLAQLWQTQINKPLVCLFNKKCVCLCFRYLGAPVCVCFTDLWVPVCVCFCVWPTSSAGTLWV